MDNINAIPAVILDLVMPSVEVEFQLSVLAKIYALSYGCRTIVGSGDALYDALTAVKGKGAACVQAMLSKPDPTASVLMGAFVRVGGAEARMLCGGFVRDLGPDYEKGYLGRRYDMLRAAHQGRTPLMKHMLFADSVADCAKAAREAIDGSKIATLKEIFRVANPTCRASIANELVEMATWLESDASAQALDVLLIHARDVSVVREALIWQAAKLNQIEKAEALTTFLVTWRDACSEAVISRNNTAVRKAMEEAGFLNYRDLQRKIWETYFL